MNILSIFRGLVVGFFVAFLITPAFSFAQSAPYATTLAPSSVTEKSARLNGRANPGGTSDAFQWFEWGISGHPEVYSTQHNSMWTGNVMVDTSADISGLAPNTQYFYRQIVENSRGRDSGITTSFITKPLATGDTPIILVETDDAKSIDEGSAILNGYVSPHGNTTGKSWFEWGKTAALGSQTPNNYVGGNSAPTQFTLTGLESGTPYYFRLAAESSSGRSYGVTKTFTTLGTKIVQPVMVPSGNTASGQQTAVTSVPTTVAQAPKALAPTGKKCLNLTVNLSKNSRSASVFSLQVFLVDKGFLVIQPTGYFGTLTVSAVKNYQKSRGITPTGAVFALTRQAIKKDSCAL